MPKYFSIKKNKPKWRKIERDFPFVKHVYISPDSLHLYGSAYKPWDADNNDYTCAGLCYVGYFDEVEFNKLYSLDDFEDIEYMPTQRRAEQKEKDRFADNLFDLANLISSTIFSSIDRELGDYRNLHFPRVLTDEYTTRDCILEILTNKFKTIDELVSFVEQKELAS